jgi:hypothetical protein
LAAIILWSAVLVVSGDDGFVWASRTMLTQKAVAAKVMERRVIYFSLFSS